MARPGIGYQEVEQAAVSLLEKGVTPSIQRVRAILGTGSNSTIGSHLKRWQQERQQALERVPPPPVPEAVTTAADALWRVAAAQAEALYQEQRAQAEGAVAVAEQMRAEAVLELDKACQRATELEQQLAGARRTLEGLQDELLVERERRRLAEGAIAAAEQRAEEARQTAEQRHDEAQQHLTQLATWTEQMRQDLEHRLAESEQRLRTERERGEASETRLLRIIDQNRTECAAQRQTFHSERAAWQRRETELQGQLEALQKDSAALRSTLTGAAERARLLEVELERMRTGRAALEERHLTAVRETASLHSALHQARHERQALEGQLNACRSALESHCAGSGGEHPPAPAQP